jgi:hypothetical protein
VSVLPLYGFLRGDTLGLVVLAYPEDTMRALAGRLQQAARVRVAARPGAEVRVVYRGRELAAEDTVGAVGMAPLERFDVVPA